MPPLPRIPLLASLALLSGACDTCENDSPPPSDFNFRLVSANGTDLIGRGPGLYSPDSLRVSLNGQPFYLKVSETTTFDRKPTVSLSDYQLFTTPSPARLLLRLSRTDTDTLDLEYTVRSGRCATYIEYQSARYNGRPAVVSDFYYQFVKR